MPAKECGLFLVTITGAFVGAVAFCLAIVYVIEWLPEGPLTWDVARAMGARLKREWKWFALLALVGGTGATLAHWADERRSAMQTRRALEKTFGRRV